MSRDFRRGSARRSCHFYGGLSATEIAESLCVSRTTVQSRLTRAVERLRDDLAGAGHAALGPVVVDVMRSTPPPAVPASLHVSLLGLPSTGAGGGSIAAAFGGIVMGKKLPFAVVLLACVVGSFLAGQSRRAPARAAPGGGDAVARLALEERNRELERRVRELEARRVDPDGGAETEAAARGARQGLPPEAEAPGGELDWSRFAELFAAGVDTVARAHRESREREPTAEETRTVLGIHAAFFETCEQALALAEEPFFDARVLPGLLAAIYGRSLGLDAEGQGAVRALGRAALESHTRGLDLASALPLEKLEARTLLLAELERELKARTPPGREERFESVSDLAHDFLDGSRQVISIGIRPGLDRGPAVDAVVGRWTSHFGLTEAQAGATREAAAEYLRTAERVLVECGAYAPGAAVDDETRARIRARLLRSQVETERALFAAFPEDVRRRMLASRMPCFFEVRFGAGVSSTSWSRGF
jgi:hypothetical protein